MKKNKVIFLLVILLCMLSVHAQDVTNSDQFNMVISKTDQSLIKIPIDETTRINIGNRNENREQFTISFSTGKTHYEFMLTDVTGVKYVQGSISGVIQLTESNDSWRIERDKIIFNVFSGRCSMSLYDINGNEYMSQNLSNGTTTQDIDFLPVGIYILRFNNSTTKFLKK